MKYNEVIESVPKLLGIASILAIAFGLLNLSLYYREFNIDIFTFLNSSEIIIRSSAALLRLILISAPALFLSLFFLRKPKTKDGFETDLLKFLLGAIIVVVILSYFLFKHEDVINPGSFLKYQTFLIQFFSISYLIVLSTLNFEEMEVPNRGLWFIIIVFGWVYIYSVKLEADILKKSLDTTKQTFYLNDDAKIVTYDSIKYVGRISDFFFFWDKASDKTYVFPKSEIKKIEIEKHGSK